MSKTKQRKLSAMQGKKSTTFLPPMPKLSVLPTDDFWGKGEQEAAMDAAKYIEEMLHKQHSAIIGAHTYGRSAMAFGNTQAKKQVTLEERVHSSYTHDKEKNAMISIDGLALHVPEIIAAPYLPGFALVHTDDPLALYCLGNYWYTPAAGKNSLEILAEHFAKKIMANDMQSQYFGNGQDGAMVMGGGGGGGVQTSPFRAIHPKDVQGDYEVKPWGAAPSMKGLGDFIDTKAKEQNE